MRGDELGYRLLLTISGTVGSVALIYSVCSRDWYAGRGLWYKDSITQPANQLSRAVETERVLGVIASMMAVIAICLCLLFSFCWDPYTYSESKMNPGRIRHPEKLLLTVLMPTALLYFISWCSYTSRYKEQIRSDITKLGSAYWAGICSCLTLLVILPIIHFTKECALSEPETNLKRSSEFQENI
ncbi:uncharacterized protein si:ch211-256a21.4 [Leucoraja erinacea]|uniref:uncharacterized protein si:ch211-256a21.4 n=1 Tax=Leucoraja erinaceus TaxID=7782 RepID=UPI0024580602|nr:uncharacterized protein si:ch211-256a21.4 [Leucoraja erinacea]